MWVFGCFSPGFALEAGREPGGDPSALPRADQEVAPGQDQGPSYEGGGAGAVRQIRILRIRKCEFLTSDFCFSSFVEIQQAYERLSDIQGRRSQRKKMSDSGEDEEEEEMKRQAKRQRQQEQQQQEQQRKEGKTEL